MKYFLQNLKNSIDFFLRQKLVFSRKNYFEKNENKEGIFSSEEDKAKENEFFNKYDLSFIKEHSTVQNYLENLYTLDILDKYFTFDFREKAKVLDIGCKNWFYAKGEYFFFKKYCKNLNLDGIEIDYSRLYSNLYARSEAAKFYIQGLENVHYIGKDFLKHNQKYDFITWFLPFVIEEPLLKWGLPITCFKPEKMLQHAFNSLNKNGKMLIVNQGLTEYEVQKTLCDKLNIPYIELGEIKSNFLKYKTRYGLLIKN